MYNLFKKIVNKIRILDFAGISLLVFFYIILATSCAPEFQKAGPKKLSSEGNPSIIPPPTIMYPASVSLDASGNVSMSWNNFVLMDRIPMWGITASPSSFSGTALSLTSVDTATGTLNYAGGGATMIVRHSIDPFHTNRIVLDITFTNNSGQTVPGYSITHGLLTFPANPINNDWRTSYRSSGPNGGLGYAQYIWNGGQASIVNENQEQSINFGMGSVNAGLLSSIYWGAAYNQPIPNGTVINSKLTLRMGEASLQEAQTKYASEHPYIVNWPDRRPVMPVFLRWNGDLANSTANPPLPDINFVISSAKAMKAQGIVVWDLLGNVSGNYGGNFENISVTNPVAAANVDAWFAAIRAAGLTPGLATRWGIPTDHWNSLNMYDPWYQDGSSKPPASLSDMEAKVISEIKYARDRWGKPAGGDDMQLLVYIDSTDGSQTDSWRRIQQALPGVLLMPENVSTGFYNALAPYRDSNPNTGYGLEGFLIELAQARAIWPQSFAVMRVEDDSMDRLTQFRPQIVQLVKSGVVLMGRDYIMNKYIAGVYADAAK